MSDRARFYCVACAVELPQEAALCILCADAEIHRLRVLLARVPSVLLSVVDPWGADAFAPARADVREAARLLLDLHQVGFEPHGRWSELDLADLRRRAKTPTP